MRQNFDAVTVHRHHWCAAIDPLVMYERVYNCLAIGFVVEEGNLLTEHATVSLIGLGHVKNVAVIEHLVQRQQQAGVAKLADGVHARGLGGALEQPYPYGHAVVVAQ